MRHCLLSFLVLLSLPYYLAAEEPKISVTACGYLPYTGVFLVPVDTTLSEFIKIAGGFRPDADQIPVLVFRTELSLGRGGVKKFRVDEREFGGHTPTQFILHDRDIVKVLQSIY